MSEEKRRQCCDCDNCFEESDYTGTSYRCEIKRDWINDTDIACDKFHNTFEDLTQQLQAAKEENEKITKQNKQMMELISEINLEYSDDGILSKATKYAIKQALNEVNNEK